MVNIDSLHDLYLKDENNLLKIVNEIYDRIDTEGLNPIWISINSRLKSIERVKELLLIRKEDRNKYVLWGIPYAVKDNIDVKHFYTTGGCQNYSNEICQKNAFVVEQIQRAGAILIGKTNLDQFATGLVGTRSPYGICSSVFNDEYISGGSSSGSAVCVSKGYVSFSLGSDTAGSGRVPAMFNNLIGMKPSRGLLSTRGVLAACRSLDCVSIFSETIRDVQLVFSVICQYDCEDIYSRQFQIRSCPWISTSTFRFGIPNRKNLQFFNDKINETFYLETIQSIETNIGGQSIEFDFEILVRVAQLLYGGPWLAERYVSVGQFIEQNPSIVHPIVSTIISKSKNYSAIQLFESIYQLEFYKKQVDQFWKEFDVIIVPTAPTIYKINEILNKPIELNTNLGYYTNFVNLLDMCAISIPIGFRQQDHLPFGITIISRSMSDNALLILADRIHRFFSKYLSNSNRLLELTPKLDLSIETNNFLLGVIGAHRLNQPLNYQLIERNGRFVRQSQTKDKYHLYLLDESQPIKPGLLYRTDIQGHEIELEIWSLPNDQIGSLIQLISSSLTIGNIYLKDNSIIKGFLVQSNAIQNAKDISHFSSWINYLHSIN